MQIIHRPLYKQAVVFYIFECVFPTKHAVLMCVHFNAGENQLMDTCLVVCDVEYHLEISCKSIPRQYTEFVRNNWLIHRRKKHVQK